MKYSLETRQKMSESASRAAAGQIVGGLKQAFDGFLLASGAVTGTII